jgi:hypothetical protein
MRGKTPFYSIFKNYVLQAWSEINGYAAEVIIQGLE